MTYLRKRPWRPRSPWLGNRAGTRRRGFRQDELCPASDALHDGVDLVMSVASEAAPADDIVLAEAVNQPATQSAVAPRVDVSGLLAIASVAPNPVSLARGDGAAANTSWYAPGDGADDESLLTRHSA